MIDYEIDLMDRLSVQIDFCRLCTYDVSQVLEIFFEVSMRCHVDWGEV